MSSVLDALGWIVAGALGFVSLPLAAGAMGLFLGIVIGSAQATAKWMRTWLET